MKLKEIRELLNKHILLDSFVKYKKFDYPCGKAVFDTERGMVLRQTSSNYTLITNEDLIKWLKKAGVSVSFLNIYKTKSQDTSYIEGYFTRTFEDVFDRTFHISFEIANSYSSRFLPAIFLGIYYPTSGLNIKSTIKATAFSRANLLEKPFNFECIQPLYNIAVSSESITETPNFNEIPTKLKKGAFHIALTQFSPFLPISYLEIVAKVANVWRLSSFELARSYQMKEFKNLTFMRSI